MAIIEKSGFLKYKDASGNTTLMYPITTKDNVDGMDDIDAHVASQENPHNVTADQIGAISYSAQSLTDEQKAQARANIDAAVSDHEHLFDRGVTTEGDGAAYTATVDGITTLEAGISFTMIPHTASTSKTATLNVNGLGAKMLRRPLSTNNTTTVANATDNWMYANKPVEVMYNGTYWIVTSMPRPNGPDIYGTVPVSAGGVPSATTADNGKFLRVVDGTPAWVAIGNAEEASF